LDIATAACRLPPPLPTPLHMPAAEHCPWFYPCILPAQHHTHSPLRDLPYRLPACLNSAYYTPRALHAASFPHTTFTAATTHAHTPCPLHTACLPATHITDTRPPPGFCHFAFLHTLTPYPLVTHTALPLPHTLHCLRLQAWWLPRFWVLPRCCLYPCAHTALHTRLDYGPRVTRAGVPRAPPATAAACLTCLPYIHHTRYGLPTSLPRLYMHVPARVLPRLYTTLPFTAVLSWLTHIHTPCTFGYTTIPDTTLRHAALHTRLAAVHYTPTHLLYFLYGSHTAFCLVRSHCCPLPHTLPRPILYGTLLPHYAARRMPIPLRATFITFLTFALLRTLPLLHTALPATPHLPHTHLPSFPHAHTCLPTPPPTACPLHILCLPGFVPAPHTRPAHTCLPAPFICLPLLPCTYLPAFLARLTPACFLAMPPPYTPLPGLFLLPSLPATTAAGSTCADLPLLPCFPPLLSLRFATTTCPPTLLHI